MPGKAAQQRWKSADAGTQLSGAACVHTAQHSTAQHSTAQHSTAQHLEEANQVLQGAPGHGGHISSREAAPEHHCAHTWRWGRRGGTLCGGRAGRGGQGRGEARQAPTGTQHAAHPTTHLTNTPSHTHTAKTASKARQTRQAGHSRGPDWGGSSMGSCWVVAALPCPTGTRKTMTGPLVEALPCGGVARGQEVKGAGRHFATQACGIESKQRELSCRCRHADGNASRKKHWDETIG